MKISLTSDYVTSTGNPENYLRLQAEAGFSHVMWCHQWCTDFLYTKSELVNLRSVFRKYGIILLDIHGSAGQEKCWYSTVEYQRQAGVELVVNRIEMLDYMNAEDSGTLMMHFPTYRNDQTPEIRQRVADCMKQLRKSLDELMPVLDKYNRAISLENMWADNWESMAEILRDYPANRIGICYDTGHGNSNALKQNELLNAHKERLIATHLDDNHGEGDQHQPPYYGLVDWQRVAQIVAESGYPADKPLSFELAMRNTPFFDVKLQEQNLPQTDESIAAYLADARERCEKFVHSVESFRNGK